MAHLLKALAIAKGDLPSAHGYALAQFGNAAETMVLQRATTTGSISGDDPGLTSLMNEFMPLVARASVIARINAVSKFRAVPVATRLLKQTVGSSASWTQEGGAIPVSDMEFLLAPEMDPLKLTAMLVATLDLLRKLGQQADAALQADCVRAVAAAESVAFLDPAAAGVDGVQPPSVTSSAIMIPSTGSTDAALAADFAALITAYEGSPESAALVMNSADALRLAIVTKANDLGPRGGEYFGVPVIGSDLAPQGLATLLDPSSIGLVDAGTNISVGTQATVTVQLPDLSTQLLSLWSENLASMRLVRYLNWRVERTGSVVCLSGLFPATL
ncbi:phage major capsid protein [Paraburkholderia sacchari]|uniref:phage major capsid protein n=1 Tax=Paraburkholderia sacchari TaxID=159450 RepID=UPI0039A5DF4C